MPTHSHPRQNLAELTARLRQRDRRITGPRQLILDLLRREEHPLTAREIHEQLECDLATVYRSLRLLEEMTMVKRFDFGDGTARFELLGQNDDGHHHHLVCRECSTVVEIGECFSGNLESRIARKHGFASVSHRLEFFGLCPECQAA
jgi:Fur family ferric uptake transcriptional regulator